MLINRIVSVPPMSEYSPEINSAPLAREMFSSLFDKLEGIPSSSAPNGEETSPANDFESPSLATTMSATEESPNPHSIHSPMSIPEFMTPGDLLSSSAVASVYAPLSSAVKAALIAETVHALTAIGGHDNPPARHIVGFEGVASVKEKLKTVSEELEDFLEVSGAVDLSKGDVIPE